jgi:hypothetical protein
LAGAYTTTLCQKSKEWVESCSWPLDRGSLLQESILPADAPFPSDYRQQNPLPDSVCRERPKGFKALQGQLRRLQPRGARKQQGSCHWKRAPLQVARMQQGIANGCQEFHFQRAHWRWDRGQTLFIFIFSLWKTSRPRAGQGGCCPRSASSRLQVLRDG